MGEMGINCVMNTKFFWGGGDENVLELDRGGCYPTL